MNLHNEKEIFYDLIIKTANHYNINPSHIEKDY
jgi:hypothetical protein